MDDVNVTLAFGGFPVRFLSCGLAGFARFLEAGSWLVLVELHVAAESVVVEFEVVLCFPEFISEGVEAGGVGLLVEVEILFVHLGDEQQT